MNKNEKKLTEKDWIDFCKKLQTGDIIFVESKDIIGKIIEFGTGDGSNLDPAHVFQYIGDGIGKTIEAGMDGIQWHVIDEYKNKFIKLENRLVIYRIKNLSADDLEKMKEKWNELIGKKYGWLSYIGWSIYGFINKFTAFGGLLKLGYIKNPFSKKEAPICSQAVYLAIEHIESVKKVFKDKRLSYENCIPENLERWTPFFAKRIIDSLEYYYKK